MKRKVLRGEGLEHFFEMHGRRGDTVYRRKRNGEFEQYEYVYYPPSVNTPLKDRTIVINRFANSVSNPQYKGYSEVVRRLYYYTPYFLEPGNYGLQGQTVFFIRESGDYEISIAEVKDYPQGDNGFSWTQRICRRTKVNLRFREEGEYEVILSKEGKEHCRRLFIVVSGDIQQAYTEYLDEHFDEIVEMPEPGYSQLRIYRRGLVAKTRVIQGISGTYRGQIYFYHKNSMITFLRANYDHSENRQSQIFKIRKASAIAAWNAESEEFRQKWNKKFRKWYRSDFRRLNCMITLYMWYVRSYIIGGRDIEEAWRDVDRE